MDKKEGKRGLDLDKFREVSEHQYIEEYIRALEIKVV